MNTQGYHQRPANKPSGYHEDETIPSGGQLDSGRRQSTAVLTSNYSPESSSYETQQIAACHANERHLDVQFDGHDEIIRRRRRRSSSFGQYISHAFATGSKTNCLFGCVLLFNLLMSIMNTMLLSFIVKSLQLKDLTLLTSSGFKALDWNRQLMGVELQVPAISALGLSVQSIESFEAKPLTITSPLGYRRAANEQIVISATRSNEANPQPENRGDDEPRTTLSNRIVIDSGGAAASRFDRTMRPVEIVTNNLVLKQTIGSQPRFSNDRTAPQGGLAGKKPEDQQQARRLLEFDGAQQSIVLSASDQINLFPSRSSSLLVADELRAQQAELSGTLDADFDVQTMRHGDLTCESRDALKLVSRSARLNLVAQQTLTISAPHLKMAAKRLHLADGIEYLDGDHLSAQSNEGERDTAWNELQAYNLALVGGKLVAVDDDDDDDNAELL